VLNLFVHENWDFLGYYAINSGNSLSTFRVNFRSHIQWSRIKFLTLEDRTNRLLRCRCSDRFEPGKCRVKIMKRLNPEPARAADKFSSRRSLIQHRGNLPYVFLKIISNCKFLFPWRAVSRVGTPLPARVDWMTASVHRAASTAIKWVIACS
jgi:hypothetical protein